MIMEIIWDAQISVILMRAIHVLDKLERHLHAHFVEMELLNTVNNVTIRIN